MWAVARRGTAAARGPLPDSYSSSVGPAVGCVPPAAPGAMTLLYRQRKGCNYTPFVILIRCFLQLGSRVARVIVWLMDTAIATFRYLLFIFFCKTKFDTPKMPLALLVPSHRFRTYK